jgi:transcriptional regulator GlxA family with amidase domain
MPLNVAIFLYPNVEVLDFAGPYEVFTTASRMFLREQPSDAPPFQVFTVAEHAAVRARAGLEVRSDYLIDDHPAIDVLMIPGGVVDGELDNAAVLAWIDRCAKQTRIIASVCTGSFLLARVGLLDGRSATTHWEDTAILRHSFPKVDVVENRRWVDLGPIVTSAGISAGIDMSLHLVERLAGRSLADRTAKLMDVVWTED